MAKASKKSPEEKLRVELSVLRGELSVAAAGRRAGVFRADGAQLEEGVLGGRPGPPRARRSAPVGARGRVGGRV